MSDKTLHEYKKALAECRELFRQKFNDYGASWRIMRPTSITDQIFIKANRIRSIQMKGETKVGDGIRGEFIAIVNYGLMGLVQLDKGFTDTPETEESLILKWYDEGAMSAEQLMTSKNHDYDEAWRSMRLTSLTDMILTKIHRTKEIERHSGATLVSEGIDANYLDMINYALFALILIDEASEALDSSLLSKD